MKNFPPLIFEQSIQEHATPEMLDWLWAHGWRHFGSEFFRYSLSIDEYGQKVIQPLRVDLTQFRHSKSQRRVLRKNADLQIRFVPASLHEEACAMFQIHKTRFTTNIPDDLSNFLGPQPGLVTPCLECQVRLGGRLVASSFFEASPNSVSSVYGMFEPAYSDRSLGILTMLVEMDWAIQRGLRFYYTGYATREPSHYDYKKNFSGLQIYDWHEQTWTYQKQPSV